MSVHRPLNSSLAHHRISVLPGPCFTTRDVRKRCAGPGRTRFVVVVVVGSVVVVVVGGGSVVGVGGAVVAVGGAVVAGAPVGGAVPSGGRVVTEVVPERLGNVVPVRRAVVSTRGERPAWACACERASLLDCGPMIVADVSDGTKPGAVATPTCATCPPSLPSTRNGNPRSTLTAAPAQMSTAMRRRSCTAGLSGSGDA
jgi:hypothetical protein